MLRDLDRGLVDFPSLRDGREVYLCWVDGEPDIEYWHDLDAGLLGPAAAVASGARGNSGGRARQ